MTHTYNNKTIGFSASYPQSWELVPTSWTKHFMMRAKNTSEKLTEYLNSGSQPFLILRKLNTPDGYAIPAVKCQAYASNVIATAGGLDKVIESVIKNSEMAFPDFVLEELQSEMLVAGVIGAKLIASMSVLNDEGESFHGTSEMYFLPAKDLVFLVCLTGTSNKSVRPKSELSEIFRSIRIK